MRTSLKERIEVVNRLSRLGVSYRDAQTLRRIAMTLHNWAELECGSDRGCIERDEKTGKPYWRCERSGKSFATPDREKGALMRLEKKIKPNYPGLVFYHQGDCRGAALYVLRASDVRENESLDSVYNRGVAVY